MQMFGLSFTVCMLEYIHRQINRTSLIPIYLFYSTVLICFVNFESLTYNFKMSTEVIRPQKKSLRHSEVHGLEQA